MVKKNFNPFIMFGSYLGALIGLIIHIMISHMDDIGSLLSFDIHIIFGTLWVIGGFLVGWGIHSLVRAARN